VKSIATWALGFCLLASIQLAAAAASPNGACDLPQGLQREIAAKYPGTKLVGLSDLEEDDRGFFQKDHGDACPGLVKVDFYGDGEPTFALVLTNARAKEHTELVVAHEVRERWAVNALDSGNPSPYAPVVWSQPAGEYRDVYGNKTIRAIRPVIVFCKYESWALLYAWTGSRVTKIWLQD
jgi:hypothetical protein